MKWLKRKLLDLRTNRFVRRRRRLFADHLSTLSSEEQEQLATGQHPSQSHARAEEARVFAEALQDHLQGLGQPGSVEIGYYHMDRIVLTAFLANSPTDNKSLPRFVHGFEVMYDWPGSRRSGRPT